jgi:hypothetical protein
VISCQNNNPKSLHADYIYRKIHKKAKRQTLLKGFALLKNDITGSEITVKILDTLQKSKVG